MRNVLKVSNWNLFSVLWVNDPFHENSHVATSEFCDFHTGNLEVQWTIEGQPKEDQKNMVSQRNSRIYPLNWLRVKVLNKKLGSSDHGALWSLQPGAFGRASRFSTIIDCCYSRLLDRRWTDAGRATGDVCHSIVCHFIRCHSRITAPSGCSELCVG